MKVGLNENVPPQFNFGVHDGKVLKSLRDLKAALYNMSDDTYRYHANKDKNDFANWVNDVFQAPALAQELRTAKTRQEAAKVLEKGIQGHKKK
jgi:predicted transcriptional regulator